jgi:hypothetical protein
MVLPPPQAKVGSRSECVEVSSRVPQSEAQIAQLKEALRQRQQIGVATSLRAQRFTVTPERAWTLLADEADDENGGVANSKLRIVKDQP